MLAAYIGATAQVKPVNGKNPLVVQAQEIHLPMPYETDDEDDDEDDEYEDEDWEEQELPEPMSEDEAINGSFPAPPKPKRHRMPPMPKVPKPKKRAKGDAWVPPFEVLPDGTVVGPTVGDGDPSRLPEGFDPPRGTFEGVTSIFRPPGSSGGENMPRNG